MGIIGDAVDSVLQGLSPFDGPGRAQRRGTRIAQEGQRATGRLVGMKVRRDAEMAETWQWAIEVRSGTAIRRAGCVQAEPPAARSILRLGMDVDLRLDGDDIVLDWDPAGPGGWRPSKPVADGIDDVRSRKVEGERRDVKLLGWRERRFGGMLTEEVDLRLALGTGEEDRWHKAWVPAWAGHLLAPGVVLPVGVRDGDRVVVDWLAAIERHGTGVGVEPATPEPPGEDVAVAAEAKARVFAGGLVGAGTDDGADAPHGVCFDQWVAVSAGLTRDRVKPADADAYAQGHGVPPGAWSAGEAAWKGRMIADWQIGARYGEAYVKALKGR
jgi:hypothetical protein